VIVGYDDIIESAIMSLLASGHVLLEGVPGLGKTKLVSTLSEVVHPEVLSAFSSRRT
jgi:MoxR-like ATPase